LQVRLVDWLAVPRDGIGSDLRVLWSIASSAAMKVDIPSRYQSAQPIAGTRENEQDR